MNIFNTAKEHWTYESFAAMLEALLQAGKTTGEDQSADYLDYARLNQQRMRRWDKTFVPGEDMVALVRSVKKQEWWVITEGWCGDGAQNLPVIARLAKESGGNIQLRIVLRDDNPGIMERYLTNGSRSIPILVSFDTEGTELFRWGPRPQHAQQMLLDWKNSADPASLADFKTAMHAWYTHDKGKAVQGEIGKLLRN